MSAGRVMLLIDADNVSTDIVEQAVARVLEEHGAIHVRRAYCTVETAAKQMEIFKRLSIRPMVNLVAGKNCTDIALAIDAMDLATAERPDLVFIVSSDSDFAPLVVRLREKGCRVCGIGQQGKTGEDTPQPYDDFDIAVIRALQGDMPVIEEPYTPAAAELGITQTRFLDHLAGMQERGLLRRVAAILYHRRAGFSANGMGVWKVPDEDIL